MTEIDLPIIEEKKSKKKKDKKDKERKRKAEEVENGNLESELEVSPVKKKKKKTKVLDSPDLIDEGKVKKKKKKETELIDSDTPKKEKKKKRKSDSVIDGVSEKILNRAEEVCEKETNGKRDESSDDNSKPIAKRTRSSSSCCEDSDPIAMKGSFNNFRMTKATVECLKERGIKYLFPVQAETFDPIFDGFDVIAQARTGTGKTYAFAIPVVEKIHAAGRNQSRGRPPQALVMAPTRELAIQVCENFKVVANGLSCLAVYGGAPYEKQEYALRSGVDVVVGTPGRVFDFAQKGTLILSELKYMILDEVDRMLDMGFADSVDEILQFAYKPDKKEENPQSLLFSATLPRWVMETAKKYMKDSVKKIDLVGRDMVKTATTVQHLAIKCGFHDRASTIGDVLQVYSGNHGRAMVFCETKREADSLTMSTSIKQEAHVLHGDIPQDKRELVLKSFREGKYKVLITTDVAARGLDIPEVDLVIQCSPPKDVDSYIHRSGRTGRAGRTGTCVCFYKPREDYALRTVEQKAGVTFQKIAPPSPEAIVKASAHDAARSLDNVSDSLIELFEESADNLIKERGANKALAAALAVISGSTELKARSLLNASENTTTYLFTTNIVMDRKGYVFRALERQLPKEVVERVVGMRFFKDHKGCAFDIPNEFESVFNDNWTNGKFDSLSKATELPELEDDQPSFGGGGGQRFGNRGGNFRFGSGGGGRRFGGGGGGGGRGGRGGRGGFGNRSFNRSR